VAERQIAGMMGQVGKNFKPGQPTKLWAPTMSGGDNFARQRAIKLVVENKRLGLHLGAGSGKSLVSMAAFTHLNEQGKAKRALFAVPSIVQGQFGGEALRYLEPGKFNWHCDPGASRDQRIAAYKNPDHHFVVTTHQALRDDLIHLGAQHSGVSTNEMRDKLSSMSRGERKGWMADVMKREGINFDFSAVDEGHNLLDRQGKEDSGMSMAIGAMTDNTPYHVSMTADPVRNDDASEVFSALQKIDPDRYSDLGSFMRRYGADTVGSKDALKREMARYFYAHSIQPNVRADKKEISVPMSAGQKSAMKDLESNIAEIRMSRMEGKVNVDAAKLVSPGSFEGAPVEQHEAIAKGLQSAIGVIKEAAVQRIINEHPESEKANEVVRQIKARPGKPGIVFTRSLKSVEAMRSKLESEGLRVVTITGADSSEEKDRKRKMFSPDSGEAQADVLVASDAASTGLNAQRGQWVMQYDTPMTAATHAQRQARVHRIGQKNNVELIDLVGDHPSERVARDRLARKYAMRDVMSSPLEQLDDTGVAMFLKRSSDLL
jgi:superfamily II DNA or RNA helicase